MTLVDRVALGALAFVSLFFAADFLWSKAKSIGYANALRHVRLMHSEYESLSIDEILNLLAGKRSGS